MPFAPLPIDRKEMIEIADCEELQDRWKMDAQRILKVLLKNPGVKFKQLSSDCYWKYLYVIVPACEDPFIMHSCVLIKQKDNKMRFER